MQTIKYSRDHKKSPSPQVWILKMLHFFIESTVILTYIEHLNSNQRARGWKEVRIRNYLGKEKVYLVKCPTKLFLQVHDKITQYA